MQINGYCASAFDEVKQAFELNFSQRKEQGAACCIYYRGEKVVDLWGGDRAPAKAWDEDTLGLTFSVTKGMAAAAMAVAHSRGLFALDVPVAEYWPDFGQAGKAEITVRQLLTHQAGLIAVDEHLSPEKIANANALATILARQKPAWKPGTHHGYHTLTLGWYQSELLRRVDPLKRTLGRFFQDEVAKPLGVQFFIGLPRHVEEEQLAVTKGFHRLEMLGHLGEMPTAMLMAGLWPTSLVARSVNILRLNNPALLGSPEYRKLEIPAANGFGQARAVAKIYSVLAGDGRELGISAATRQELHAPPPSALRDSRDAVLKITMNYGFGFSKPSRDMSFGLDDRAFGCPGAGGCLGMADPTAQLGFAYITNKMGFRLFDDPRERACRDACYRALSKLRPVKMAA